jgi:hypothetical protein
MLFNFFKRKRKVKCMSEANLVRKALEDVLAAENLAAAHEVAGKALGKLGDAPAEVAEEEETEEVESVYE